MTIDSYIHYGKGGTAFVGPDAMAFFRAAVIANAMRLYAETGIRANRAYTPTAMRQAASDITKKHYGRGNAELLRAADDLELWAREMKAALPQTIDTDKENRT